MARRPFSAIAPVMHALIAVFTFFLLVSSWWMMALPLPSEIFTYRAYPFQLHKNVGITLVFLVVLMLYGRVVYLRAARAAGVEQPRPSRAVVVQNVLLYGLVFVCSLSGYLSSSYSGWGTRLWWLVDLPNWGYDNDYLNELYSEIHIWTTYTLIAVLAVHVYAAMYHAFQNKGFIRRLLHL